MSEQTPAPAVGQVWADNDPRGYGRRLRIVEIDGTHAVVHDGTRQSRIRLDRFRPTNTGYRYVSGPEGGAR